MSSEGDRGLKLSPSIFIEEANPDIFYDTVITCLASGMPTGEAYVTIAAGFQGVGEENLSPCGWDNLILLPKLNGYETKALKKFEKLTFDEQGRMHFGLKFLALSKDGLLPQLPLRVVICPGPEIKNIIAMSDPFRVIEYKIAMAQSHDDVTIPDGKQAFPKFEVFLHNAKKEKVHISVKLDVNLLSTTCDPSTPVTEIVWNQEHGLQWGYKSGDKAGDLVKLPIVLECHFTPKEEKTAYRLRVSVVAVSRSRVAFTRIGSGLSTYFALPVASSSRVEVGPAVTDAISAPPPIVTEPTQQSPVLTAPASLAPTTRVDELSTNPIPGSIESASTLNETVPTKRCDEDTEDAGNPHKRIKFEDPEREEEPCPLQATQSSVLLSPIDLGNSSDDAKSMKGPKEVFRQYAQFMMKALYTAYNLKDDTVIPKSLMDDAFTMYDTMDVVGALRRLQNPRCTNTGQWHPPEPPREMITESLRDYAPSVVGLARNKNNIPTPRALPSPVPEDKMYSMYRYEPSSSTPMGGGYANRLYSRPSNEAYSEPYQQLSSLHTASTGVLSAGGGRYQSNLIGSTQSDAAEDFNAANYLMSLAGGEGESVRSALQPKLPTKVPSSLEVQPTPPIVEPKDGAISLPHSEKSAAENSKQIYVNLRYVAYKGIFLGYPAHQLQSFELSGFYEDGTNGLQFVKRVVPADVKDVLEQHCSQEHTNPRCFVKVSADDLFTLKRELGKSSQKEYYDLN